MPYAELMGPARMLANRSSSPRSVVAGLQAMYASVCCAPVNACLLVPAAGVLLCFSPIAPNYSYLCCGHSVHGRTNYYWTVIIM